MDKEFLSEPLVVAGLLFGLAALILLFGLALQAWTNRRRGWHRPLSHEDASVDLPDRGGEDLIAAQEPVANGQLPEDQRLMEELEARIDEAIDARFDEIEDEFETRIDGVEDEFDDRFEIVESAIDAGFDEVGAKVASAVERPQDRRWMEEFETRIEEVEAKIEEVDAKATTAVKPVGNDKLPEDQRLMNQPASDNGSRARHELERLSDSDD